MIYSIFQNLIENAFTYRDKQREKPFIKIRIEIDQQKTVFEFVDNGVGINKDLKDKVFDMFYRASDISGGSGLGLYLVKMAVNKIGGRINVESKMKKGTIFTIVI
jgi:signal transduction histidine kinase